MGIKAPYPPSPYPPKGPYDFWDPEFWDSELKSLAALGLRVEQCFVLPDFGSLGVSTGKHAAGLGAVMDEFDLRIEDLNAKKGCGIAALFNMRQHEASV